MSRLNNNVFVQTVFDYFGFRVSTHQVLDPPTFLFCNVFITQEVKQSIPYDIARLFKYLICSIKGLQITALDDNAHALGDTQKFI